MLSELRPPTPPAQPFLFVFRYSPPRPEGCATPGSTSHPRTRERAGPAQHPGACWETVIPECECGPREAPRLRFLVVLHLETLFVLPLSEPSCLPAPSLGCPPRKPLTLLSLHTLLSGAGHAARLCGCSSPAAQFPTPPSSLLAGPSLLWSRRCLSYGVSVGMFDRRGWTSR